MKNKEDITTQEWLQMQDEFIATFFNYRNDLYQSISTLHSETKQFWTGGLCFAFIAIDTFSRFQKIFEGYTVSELDKHNKGRFKDWVNHYLLNRKRNTLFKENEVLLPCDTNDLYALRNSFLHYYSFPEFEDKFLCFAFNISQEEQKRQVEYWKPYISKQIVLVDGNKLIEAIFEGIDLLITDIKNKVGDDFENYKNNLYELYKVLPQTTTRTVLVQKKQ